MKPHIGELIFFWMLFGLVGLLAFAVMSPYFTIIFLSAVLAIVFHPLYGYMRKIWKQSENAAAFASVLVVVFLILAPMVFLAIVLFQEVVSLYGSIEQPDSVVAAFTHYAQMIEGFVQQFVPQFTFKMDVATYAGEGLSWVERNLNGLFSGILEFIFDSVLVLIAMFFFLRDGEKLHKFAIEWSPLSDRYDEGIMAKLSLAVASVVRGSLMTAVIQGVLVGIGFALFGIPNPVLWGIAATIAALLPLLGTAIITVPAGVVLLISGNLPAGIGILLWAIFPVGTIDNFLDPYFYGKGIDVHPLLILLSVLGGLIYFGPIGFLAGPIVLAFFFALLDIYPDIVKGRAIDGAETT